LAQRDFSPEGKTALQKTARPARNGMKKLLIIAYYWPPSGGPGVQRWLKFVKYLKAEGFDPHVLTVENPTYPIVDPSLAADIPENTPVFTAPAWEPYALYAKLLGKKPEDVSKLTIELNKRGASKEGIGNWIRANFFVPDARIGWIQSVVKKAVALNKEHGYAGFITTGPPHSTHVAGLRIKKKTGLYWLCDMRDPWVDIHYNQLIPRSAATIRFDRRLERKALTTADDVIVVTPGMKRDFETLYANRYHVIPNGFDEEDLPPPVNRTPEPGAPFLMRHVGSMPESTIPYGFFEAASRLPETLNWRLEFIGNVHPELKRLTEHHGLADHIVFIPYVPHAEALLKMQEADVLCIFLAKTPGAQSIYSGKLFEYAGLRKPVLFIGATDGDGARFLRDAGLGMSHEHTDSDGILNTLSVLITRQKPLPVPDVLQNQFINGFSRRELTKRLIEVVKQRLE
jgi:glycosyltransferase involved in cell wall biosynthesis